MALEVEDNSLALPSLIILLDIFINSGIPVKMTGFGVKCERCETINTIILENERT
jgi:hypothetical protein